MARQSKISSAAIWLFLAGLGSATQVQFFGSVAITELFMFAFGPVFFFKNLYGLRRDGFLPFVTMAILTCIGCLVASKFNDAPVIFMLKGLAVPAVYFTSVVTFHHLLSRDMSAMKWYLIGSFLSGIICIFIFQQATYTADSAAGEIMQGEDAVSGVVGYSLFWSKKIKAILTLPTKCFYLTTPSVYNWSVPIFCAAISLVFSSGSGRASAAVGLGGAMLLFFGGKSPHRIAKFGKHIVLFAVGLVFLALAFKGAYAYFAKNGALGEFAKRKYFHQTATGSGMLDILMAGRMEFFCGLFACVDKPIIGWGPKAEDTGNYVHDYLLKYGADEDFKAYLRSLKNDAIYGYRYRTIPAHSHIESAWLYYGVFGLLFWIYVIMLMYKYIRYYASAIPQWFGFLGVTVVSMSWSILFNPPGGRLGEMFFVSCILFCRAVYRRRIQLPDEMLIEIQQIDRRS